MSDLKPAVGQLWETDCPGWAVVEILSFYPNGTATVVLRSADDRYARAGSKGAFDVPGGAVGTCYLTRPHVSVEDRIRLDERTRVVAEVREAIWAEAKGVNLLGERNLTITRAAEILDRIGARR